MMRADWPDRMRILRAAPAGMSATTGSRKGRLAVVVDRSAAMTAKPSTEELSKTGRSIARMLAARTRPEQRAKGTVSALTVEKSLKIRVWADRTLSNVFRKAAGLYHAGFERLAGDPCSCLHPLTR